MAEKVADAAPHDERARALIRGLGANRPARELASYVAHAHGSAQCPTSPVHETCVQRRAFLEVVRRGMLPSLGVDPERPIPKAFMICNLHGVRQMYSTNHPHIFIPMLLQNVSQVESASMRSVFAFAEANRTSVLLSFSAPFRVSACELHYDMRTLRIGASADAIVDGEVAFDMLCRVAERRDSTSSGEPSKASELSCLCENMLTWRVCNLDNLASSGDGGDDDDACVVDHDPWDQSKPHAQQLNTLKTVVRALQAQRAEGVQREARDREAAASKLKVALSERDEALERNREMAKLQVALEMQIGRMEAMQRSLSNETKMLSDQHSENERSLRKRNEQLTRETNAHQRRLREIEPQLAEHKRRAANASAEAMAAVEARAADVERQTDAVRAECRALRADVERAERALADAVLAARASHRRARAWKAFALLAAARAHVAAPLRPPTRSTATSTTAAITTTTAQQTEWQRLVSSAEHDTCVQRSVELEERCQALASTCAQLEQRTRVAEQAASDGSVRSWHEALPLLHSIKQQMDAFVHCAHTPYAASGWAPVPAADGLRSMGASDPRIAHRPRWGAPRRALPL